MNRAEKRIMLRRRARTKRVIQWVCLFAMVFVGVLILLFQQVECNSLMRQISDLETQISIAESERVRLNSELSSMTSAENIEYYAEEVLGMVKAESYQISYIDLSEGDKIVVSGNKVPGEDDKLVRALNELFAFLFSAEKVAGASEDDVEVNSSGKEEQ